MRGEAVFRDVDYRIAQTTEEREAIYALRYRAYLRGGLIAESADQRVTDKYDDAPNTWVFGVYLGKRLSGSIRIHLLTKECRESICAVAYGDILNPRLDRGEVFIDAARFVRDPDIDVLELPHSIMRLGFVACEAFNADTEIIVCSPDHARFYERYFLHKPLTPSGFLPGILTPAILLGADFKADREKVMRRHPIMASSAFERRMLFGTDGLLPMPIAA